MVDKLSSKSINIKNGYELYEQVIGGEIYFIMNRDGYKMLYAEKAEGLKVYFKQHLQTCYVPTSSHIEDVIVCACKE